MAGEKMGQSVEEVVADNPELVVAREVGILGKTAGKNQIVFDNPSNYAPDLDSITISPLVF